MLCISFKSWNQEHPIQPSKRPYPRRTRCVYPSNLEIKNILYNPLLLDIKEWMVVYILQILESRTSYTTMQLQWRVPLLLCISFKFWNQEHPIQLVFRKVYSIQVVYILQILKSRTSYTTVILNPFGKLCCVYPSNLEIKNILYNRDLSSSGWLRVVYILQILKPRTSYTTMSEPTMPAHALCISFKPWNQEHPIQRSIVYLKWQTVVYILQILKSRTSYTT